MHRLLSLLAVGVLAFAIMLGIRHNQTLNQKYQLKQLEVQTKDAQIKINRERTDKLLDDLNKYKNNDKKYQETKKKLEKQERENKRLQEELQAKREARRIAALEASQSVFSSNVYAESSSTQTAVTGSCESWMTEAGISDLVNAYNIFQKESGCSPTASNPSSFAHGVCQSLPASKMSSHGSDYMTNPITQMRWCEDYAIARYGSWASAWAFWQQNHWW